MQPKINLLFPIEIQNRELDFRLFLACLCARAHNRIFIGQHVTIFRLAQRMRGGLYVGKHVFGQFPETDRDRYATIKENGLTLVHLDEEGVPFDRDAQKRRVYMSRRLEPDVLAADDYVCTWGDFQRDFYREQKPRCAENILTTGHPRFDLCKPEHRAFFAPAIEKIRAQFGDFILINTNFTYETSQVRLGDAFSKQRGYDPSDPVQRSEFLNQWAHRSKIRIDFVRLANRLSVEFPHLNIVVRPHPAEGSGYYTTIFKGVGNVHINQEGSVLPWMMASRLMIHSGCTTAIEAFLGRLPIIRYESLRDTYVDSYLPDSVGTLCQSEDATVAAAREMLAAPTEPADRLDAVAHSLIHNFRHPSFAPLVEIIERAEATHDPARQSCDWAGFEKSERVRARIYQGKAALGVLAPLNPVKRTPHGRTFAHHRAAPKFYGLRGAGIDGRLARIQAILGKVVTYTIHRDDLMSIEAA